MKVFNFSNFLIFLLLLLSFSNFVYSGNIVKDVEGGDRSAAVGIREPTSTENFFIITYWILIGVFFMACSVTALMIYQYYGGSHLFQIILFLAGSLTVGLSIIYLV